MSGPENDPSDRGAQLRLQFTDEVEPEESIIEADDGLVEWLRNEFENKLRVVGVYSENTFEFLYVNPVVREQYTRQEFAATGDEFVLSGRQEDSYQERLYHLGSFEYEVRGFEEGQVVRVPVDMRKGLIISFEKSVNISVPQFIDQLKRRHEIAIC
ncbi:hypothetical protein SAMN04487948_11037 [Halogranum amylolyticum]|uniref:Uncharacterized protein n=1 Tax=Halogranum amylolyticum TaxID=660520 RepID=A0A1H8U9I3_9EURY|nr:hypothetical protein [Halogranum amylolyticum]SEO99879.1 hypothetical protein SAMN04487948_11037 [Halogranum amylolyticum]